MASYNPVVKNVAYVFAVALQDLANPGSYKATPTLAAGDVKVDIDGAGFSNLASLPTVTPAAGRRVQVSLTAGEMNGDNITIQFVDQTNPKEWADLIVVVQTSTWLALLGIPSSINGESADLAGMIVGVHDDSGLLINDGPHIFADELLARNAAGGSDGPAGQTVADYIQGKPPKIVQTADGLSVDIYKADGVTILATVPLTRLVNTIGAIKNIG